MGNSLLFIPDISGFTHFVHNTEIAHSQHVISELLEVLVNANTQNLKLAEVEGDALFFYKENEIPSQEKLLAQIETMFTAFYSHLRMLEKNRICPCNACATASDLQLKIIIHSGDLQFITVQEKRKPFGRSVIEAHRLLKNSINSENYALLSDSVSKSIGLSVNYKSKLYHFYSDSDIYDDRKIEYLFSEINKENLKLNSFPIPEKIDFTIPPAIVVYRDFEISSEQLFECITNYSYRHFWAKGVDKIEYNPDEVTRLGTEHLCVIGGKHLNFTTVTKNVDIDNVLVYGELTNDVPVDRLYQFFIIQATSENTCKLTVELYPIAETLLSKLLLFLMIKKSLRKSINTSLDGLENSLKRGDVDL